jgi:peroxiredoxin Q/BCP
MAGFFRRARAVLVAPLVLLAPAPAAAEASLEAGSKAPPFELLGPKGAVHRLEDHLGQRGVVLAWFPKAFTPG